MRQPHPTSASLLGTLLLAGCTSQGDDAERADVYVVERGSLPITVTEQGEIQPAESTRIKNEMEGQSTIIYLIEEGTVVDKGQKLVELDASNLIERRAQQEISLHRAGAQRTSALEELEIRRKEYEADKLAARNNVEIAQIDLDKFLGKENDDGTREMGEREQQLLDAQANIELAHQELKLARNKLEWSRKLLAKGFITKDDVERDQLDADRREKTVKVEENKLDILENYTHVKQLIALRQAIKQAETDYEGVVARGKSRIAQAEADLDASRKEYELAKERFDNLETQIENALIRAPTPGLVVYAMGGGWRGDRDIVEEGATVRERQTLIELPDVTNMVAQLKVHEAAVRRVHTGQRARIQVAAFADREFTGVVRRVASVADSGSRWSNNNLKVYKTEVEIDGRDLALKPGMTASVSILVAELEDVLYVPLQAIQRKGAVTYVWLDAPGGPTARVVDLGLNDFQFVEVVEGLEEGDRVFMAVPPDAGTPALPQPPEQDVAALTASTEPAADTREPPERAGADAPGPGTSDRGARGHDDPGRGDDAGRAGDTREGDGRGRNAMRELTALLRRKFPDLGELEGRELFRNEKVRAARENDPEVKAAFEKLMAGFRGRRGERSRGERSRGERGRGGPRGERADGGDER